MNLISPVMSSRIETLHSIRQRKIDEASNRIATGDRFSADPSKDSAAYRISKRMEIESKFSDSARKNFDNVYILAQQQADIISYAESVIKQMNKLAYEATDPTSSDYHREVLNEEFQEHSKTLQSLMFDRTFEQQLLDPQSAEYIDKTIIYDDEESSSGANIKKVDISAIGAKIKLWWNTSDSNSTRDRIQLKQGDRWFFDSGEYLSDNGSGVRSENVDGQITYGDFFEIDIRPNQISYTTASDNMGDSNSSLAPGYPKVQSPLGDSTIIEIAVNEPGPENISRSNPTGWSWRLSWDAEQIDGPKGVADEKGSLYELSPLGFSTLKGYDISTRLSAANALDRSKLELESLSKQIYTLAKTFSEVRLKSDYIGQKNTAQNVALGRINDSDMASEYTSLAKNLLLQKVSNHALVHSRVSAENVMNLIS
jgi:flagellin-like hook-associated protein FlgL